MWGLIPSLGCWWTESGGSYRVMMKGDVNLSLSGTGQGINLGIAFGRFRIEPR